MTTTMMESKNQNPTDEEDAIKKPERVSFLCSNGLDFFGF